MTCSCFAALQACSWQALDKSTTPQFTHDISTFTYISTGYLCITGTDNASVMLYEASSLTEGEHGHLRFFKFLQRDRAFTALHLAVCHQRIEQVTMLLGQSGISTSARTQQHGLTPLHIAALTGNAQIAETLLRSCSRGGAPPHALHAALHARDKLTLAPLDHAAAWAQAGTAELLLAWGAPVNQLSWSTETPLTWAAGSRHAGNHVLIALLLQRGACLSHVNSGRRTALHYTSLRGSVPGTSLLLQAAAQQLPHAERMAWFHQKDETGRTALERADTGLVSELGNSPDCSQPGAANLLRQFAAAHLQQQQQQQQ